MTIRHLPLGPFNCDHLKILVWFVCTSLVLCGHDWLYLKRSLKSKSRSMCLVLKSVKA